MSQILGETQMLEIKFVADPQFLKKRLLSRIMLEKILI